MKLASKATPAAVAVLRQATALRPLRNKLSDGLLPSVAHQKQNPNSDHNTGLAVDITHDAAHGIDCAEMFERLKEDRRVEYLIYNSKIWSKSKAAQGNRKYIGANKHEKHLHISIKQEFSQDTSPWFWWMNQPSIAKQLVAKAIPTPAKKAYTTQVCTCCKVHKKGVK
jgi:hypothetical protein